MAFKFFNLLNFFYHVGKHREKLEKGIDKKNLEKVFFFEETFSSEQ